MKSHETPQGRAAEFLLPWEPVSEADAKKLLRELALQLSQNHRLFGMKLDPVARSVTADDGAFRLQDGRFAWVHLSWIGREERLPFPSYRVYAGFAEWSEAVMLPEHDSYD